MSKTDASTESQANFLRLRTVAVLYATYLCFYLARKADAISKSGLARDEKFDLDDLARSDTAYLFTYTFALFASGGWLRAPRR
jgi:sugar phosphate permease